MPTRFTRILGAAFGLILAAAAHATSNRPSTPSAQTLASSLPLSFEPNRGQFDEQVRFLSRGPGYALFLTDREAVWRLRGDSGARQVVRMQLVGANPQANHAEHPLPGRRNYYDIATGKARATEVGVFGAARFDAVWPGVDLVYYGRDGELEYDFEVAPGANPETIDLRFVGATARIGEDGSLLLGNGLHDLSFKPPVAYQVVDGKRRLVASRYALRGSSVGIDLGEYDRSRPLVIDPVITYGTFLGGSDYDEAYDIARDASGNLYVTGSTASTDFPVQNPVQGNLGGEEVFVSKIDPSGSNLVFSTYLGGPGRQWATAIEVDTQGNPFLCGVTKPDSNYSSFVLKLNANGSFAWSRVENSTSYDECADLALDDGAPVVVGYSYPHADFPRVNALPNWDPASSDAPFLMRYDSNGNLLQSTLLPNNTNSNDYAAGVAVRDGYAYVTGTWTPDGSNWQVYVIKLDGDATFPEAGEYLTNFGGSEDGDNGRAIVVDSSGRAFVAGSTNSSDFPVSMDAFDSSYGGGNGDVFIARLSAAGSLSFASYLDVSIDYFDTMRMAFDPANSLYLVGPYLGLVKLPNFGTQFGYHTEIPGLESRSGIVLQGVAQPVVVGGANSSFATTPGAVQTQHGGGGLDAAVAAIAERLPVISVEDASIAEGYPCGILVVSLDAPSTDEVHFDWSTSGGTASPGADFTPANGSASITETNPVVTVCTADDSLHEGDETLVLSLSNVTGATVGDATATITILDDDPQPSISINDVSVTEGTGGSVDANFYVSLDAASAQTITVHWATANGTATAPNDYANGSGTLTFTPGQVSKYITRAITTDALDEADETFFINLSSPTNATIADAQGQATINDDDAMPDISIDDVSVIEGTGGVKNVAFTVSLNKASAQTITVDWATADGTATSPEDYAALSGILTFTPGQTSKVITRAITTDALDEDNEFFFINLSNATNANIADAQGQATIINDDGVTITIDDVSVDEHTGGAHNVAFTISLNEASPQTVTVDWATADGTATSPADYTALSGVLTFVPGQTSKTVTRAIITDALDEADETFFINLSNATNATIADAQGQATIIDDDAAPGISINDVSVTEGSGGANNVAFTVSLSAASGRTITVDWATANGTATASDDYAPGSGTMTFAPGQTSKPITRAITTDALDEDNETFFVNLSNPTNATLGDAQGQATIIDDDDVTISIEDVSLTEGTGGNRDAVFIVNLSRASSQTITVDWTAANGTATASNDYAPGSGTMIFTPGQTSKAITRAIVTDALDEVDETFFINLSNPTNASIADAQGKATIIDDDNPPTISINDPTITEGTGGSTNISFTVSLNQASGRTITVDWATANGSATAPADYAAGSGTMTFTAGQTSKAITRAIVTDALDEADETFFINLGNATNATLEDAQGLATITDDDDPPNVSIDDCQIVEGASGTSNCQVRIHLDRPSGRPVTVDWAVSRAAANALENGGFESPLIGGAFASFSAPQVFGGWTVDIGSVELVHGLWTHATGAQSLDLNGSGPGTVSATYQNPGPSRLSLAYTASPGCGPGIESFDVGTLAGPSYQLDADPSGHDYDNMGWQWIELPGSSVVGEDTIFLAGNNQGPCGIAIDDIVVVPADVASPPVDLPWSSGSLVIPAGATESSLIDIPVNGDGLDEIDERFLIDITGGLNFAESSHGIGTILNDDSTERIFCDGFDGTACP